MIPVLYWPSHTLTKLCPHLTLTLTALCSHYDLYLCLTTLCSIDQEVDYVFQPINSPMLSSHRSNAYMSLIKHHNGNTKIIISSNWQLISDHIEPSNWPPSHLNILDPTYLANMCWTTQRYPTNQITISNDGVNNNLPSTKFHPSMFSNTPQEIWPARIMIASI